MKNVLNVPNLDTSLLTVGRNDNGAGSGRVAPIPTRPVYSKQFSFPSHLKN